MLKRSEKIGFGVAGLFLAGIIGFLVTVTLQTHTNLNKVENLVRESARVRIERLNTWQSILNLPFEVSE
jgi:hypothetical protein